MTKLTEKKRRPTGVTAVVILNVIIGVYYSTAGLFFESWFGTIFVRGLLVVMGMWLFLQAYGFWRGKYWAMFLGVIFTLVCIIFGLAPYYSSLNPYHESGESFGPDGRWFVQFLPLGLLYGIFVCWFGITRAEAFFD